MIEHIDTGEENVVGVRVSGKISEIDIEKVISTLEESLRTQANVSFVVEVDDLDGISPGALIKDIGFGIRQIGNLDRFDRAALITDKKWLRAAAKIESRIIPGIDVKPFKKAERNEALAWAKNGRPSATNGTAHR